MPVNNPSSGIQSGGALGTPSSGTLTNCTGLPQSGVTNLTTDLSNKQPLDTQLTDLAALSYAANALKVVRVNAGETAWELATPSGGGTVTDVSVATANGFAGSVATSTTTPAITLSTSVTGILKGNGTAVSAASAGTDYVAPSGALGTPSSGTLTNCTFPTLNQNSTGSAASLSVAGQTGLVTLTGITSTNRTKTVRDAADTLLELGGSYTPTGTWTNLTLANPALGTPASGTLTNCSGLPQSGVTNLTTDLSNKQPLDAQLTDLASLSYASNALKVVRVNAGETSWELATLAGGGDVTGDDTSTTIQNIVAYNSVGGKNITELTGTQGDVLYHNGTNWAKLSAGVAGQFLRTGGAGANPAWAYWKLFNRSTGNQGAGFSSDTYLTGSNISIPNSSLKIGTVYKLTFRLSKTNAGTATPILTLRIGTNGSTADTARCTFTFTAGTAAVDEGMFEVWATFDSVGSGSSAVLRGTARCTHRLSVTGITGTNAVSETEHAVSAGFDSTVSNSIIGLSVNGGASASWTVQHVMAEMENFA